MQFCPQWEMIVGRKNGITNLEGEGSLGIRVLKRCEMEINTLRKPAEREAGPRGVCSSFLRSQGSRTVPFTGHLIWVKTRLVYFPISPWSFISAHCRYCKIWHRYLLNASRSFMKGYLVPGSLEASSWSLAISFRSVGLNPLRLHYSLLFCLNISDSDILQKFEYHFLYLCFWWSVIFKMKLNITFYILLNSSCIS